jgi:hypothetical protein
MYDGDFELPPSQKPTPGKARGGAKASSAQLPGKSPAKRTHTARLSATLAAKSAVVEGSPAKKPRRSLRV